MVCLRDAKPYFTDRNSFVTFGILCVKNVNLPTSSLKFGGVTTPQPPHPAPLVLGLRLCFDIVYLAMCLLSR